MNRTDKKALAIVLAVIVALLVLATWGGSCLGQARMRQPFEEAQAQLESTKTELASVNRQLSELQSTSASLKKDNETLRAQLESSKTELSQLQSASASLQKDSEALRTQLQSIQSDLSQSQSASTGLQKDNEDLRTQLASVQADLAQAQSRIAAFQQDSAALRTQLVAAETELSQMRLRNSSLQDTVASLRTQLASSQSQLSQAQSSQTTLQQDNAALKAQLALWYAWLKSSPPPPSIPGAPSGPTINLVPTTGPPGASITVTGSGFVANASGNVFVDINRNGTNEPGEPLQFMPSSPTGTFSTTLTIPITWTAPPGAYPVLAAFPIGSPAQTSATFTVTAAP